MTVARDRVALVLVSHSRALAEGVAALARQMVGEGVKVICAAGSGEGGAELGTDATRILEAITAADNPAGTIVFMDLGSPFRRRGGHRSRGRRWRRYAKSDPWRSRSGIGAEGAPARSAPRRCSGEG